VNCASLGSTGRWLGPAARQTERSLTCSHARPFPPPALLRCLPVLAFAIQYDAQARKTLLDLHRHILLPYIMRAVANAKRGSHSTPLLPHPRPNGRQWRTCTEEMQSYLVQYSQGALLPKLMFPALCLPLQSLGEIGCTVVQDDGLNVRKM